MGPCVVFIISDTNFYIQIIKTDFYGTFYGILLRKFEHVWLKILSHCQTKNSKELAVYITFLIFWDFNSEIAHLATATSFMIWTK